MVYIGKYAVRRHRRGIGNRIPYSRERQSRKNKGHCRSIGRLRVHLSADDGVPCEKRFSARAEENRHRTKNTHQRLVKLDSWITEFIREFIRTLEKEVEKKLKKIEGSDLNILKKSLEASLVLGDVFQRMRDFVATYTFKNEAEEIEFFKTVKPRLYHRLIYYRKVYNIEMNRPVGIESQTAYLRDEIKAINRYNAKRSDFVRYYRSGMTHLDSVYYLRGRADTTLYLESFHYERDPKFSTNADFKVARIMANELLLPYLYKELEALEQQQTEQSLPRVRIT